MAIRNFTFILLLILAFVIFAIASISPVEGLKCLKCQDTDKDPECKIKTKGHECPSHVKDPICFMLIVKEKNKQTEIVRYCIDRPPEYRLNCQTFDVGGGVTYTNCFCNYQDDCDPDPDNPRGGRPFWPIKLGKSAGLTLTPSIPASFSIFACACVIAAEIQ